MTYTLRLIDDSDGSTVTEQTGIDAQTLIDSGLLVTADPTISVSSGN
jgi:hypothetical protein